MYKIFITDAGYKHTLGAVRSLGKKGYYIITGASEKTAQSFFSKYCKESIIYPDPKNKDKFINFLEDYLKSNKIDVLLPIGYHSTVAISENKERLLKFTKIPVADYQSMRIACDKSQTMEIARKIGLATPKEYFGIDDIISYPIVAKGIFESGHVRYINSINELHKISLSDTILQEYIPGEGFGLYALFNNGEEKAIFMHKRLREYPITGGSSTKAESIYDPILKSLGLSLLKALKWHGVAMVEFKKDSRDGKFKLMEINPKFWGSLDLSIASGVDFPYLISQMAIDGDINPIFDYDIDVRYQWPFPYDILHVLANPRSIFSFALDILDKKVKNNIEFSDLKPNLIQFLNTALVIINLIKNGNIKYPHNKPRRDM